MRGPTCIFWANLTPSSLQWDTQREVVAAREQLKAKGVACWMDVDGGMSRNIYDSMAEVSAITRTLTMIASV